MACFYAGIPASAQINAWRKKGTRPVSPMDFVPTPPRKLTRAQLEDQLDAWSQRVNGVADA